MGGSCSACCPRAKLGPERQGSPTQGALVTEGTATRCAQPSFRAKALEPFSGLPASPWGHRATGHSNPIIALLTNNAKGNVGVLRASYKIKGISTGGILDVGQTESESQGLVSFK